MMSNCTKAGRCSTSFPSGPSWAATFDRELMRKMAVTQVEQSAGAVPQTAPMPRRPCARYASTIQAWAGTHQKANAPHRLSASPGAPMVLHSLFVLNAVG